LLYGDSNKSNKSNETKENRNDCLIIFFLGRTRVDVSQAVTEKDPIVGDLDRSLWVSDRESIP
jgi:hypothetical protein